MTVLGLTCLRNEAPYLVDWLAHHLALGMDHVLIASHDCDDGSPQLLDALAGTGVVTHVPFQPEPGKTVQWQALRIMDRHPLLRSCEWALFFDLDEYLNLPEGLDDIPGLIAANAGSDAIALPWRLFGSGGAECLDTRPVTERFVWSAPPDLHYPLAHLFKTLHRPAAFQRLGVHRPRARKDSAPVWTLGNATPLVGAAAQGDKMISVYGQPGLRRGGVPVLNHYCVRSAQEFLVKRQRGLPNHMDRDIGTAYWAERNWNTVEDSSIRRFDGRVAEKRAWLMAQPGVAAAHEAGVAAHRDRIATLLQDIDNVRFIWRLGLLTGSTPPTAERARAFIAAQIAAGAG